METKKKSYVGSIIGIVIGVLLFSIYFSAQSSVKSDIRNYEASIEEMERGITEAENSPEIGTVVEGKEPLDNPKPFNNFNTSGRYDDRAYDESALSFYNLTGIQLYFMEFKYGTEKFETEAAIQQDVQSKLMELDNIENSIVTYTYTTDYDYKSPYYYSVYDAMYYGENVSKYLTPKDLEVINYYVSNAYDLWSFEEREFKMWTSIGDKIVNGYTVDAVERNDLEYNINYYENRIGELRSVNKINISFTIAFGALIVLCSIILFRNIRINRRYDVAQVELKEAQAIKEILEADIEPIETEDDKLVAKYLNTED